MINTERAKLATQRIEWDEDKYLLVFILDPTWYSEREKDTTSEIREEVQELAYELRTVTINRFEEERIVIQTSNLYFTEIGFRFGSTLQSQLEAFSKLKENFEN